MKTLIVYYSRSGTTRKVAEALAGILKAEVEEISEKRKRGGPIGWLKSGYEASRKKSPSIADLKHDPASYDLVVIGTPVWAGTLASPVRSFLEQHAGSIKRAGFFLTMGGERESKTFADMAALLGKETEAQLALRTHVVKKGENFDREAMPAIREFAERLQG
jgi:flavodoxin